MTTKMIKNLLFTVAIAATLSACDDHKNEGNGNFLASEPVTIDGPLKIDLTEEQGIVEASLLDGVSNPKADGVIYTRQLNYYDTDENDDPLYQGPALPNGAIRKREEFLVIDTSMWQNLLAYQETAVYNFDYLIDNGADDSVLRNIQVTITGTEDKVEQIVIQQGSEANVAIDYPLQLSATVLPQKATFKTVSWESSATDVATVSETGLVSAVKANAQATISAISADGEVQANILINTIEEPTEPLGLDIYYQEQIVSGNLIDLGEGTQIQLSTALLPEGLGFDNPIEWFSSNPNAATVSDTGLVTGIAKVEGSAIIKAKVKDSSVEQLIEVNLTDNPNLLYNTNWNFESGDIAPLLINSPEKNTGTAEVCAEAAYEGDYGLCVNSNSGKVSLYFPESAFRQITFERDAIYAFNMMVKIKSGGGGGGAAFLSDKAKGVQVFSHVAGKTWWWKGPVDDFAQNGDQWGQVQVLFKGTDLTDKLNDGPESGDVRLHFELQTPNRLFYIDNIRFIKQ
ncbi:Ig-like domain-containing protein [Gayadomonas joobiniege]|uniref:Ig-like domain-containing protein n=1 Tax=Gayadomonas joobiniege TaxID=1234606 RepID=UPI0003655426|nr:Ig-like domain-containing protein [Gayadomonas joobiniege]